METWSIDLDEANEKVRQYSKYVVEFKSWLRKKVKFVEFSRMRFPSPWSTPPWQWPQEATSWGQTCWWTKLAPAPPLLESKTCPAPKLWTTSPPPWSPPPPRPPPPPWSPRPRASGWALLHQRHGLDWWPGWIRESRSGRSSTGGNIFENLPKKSGFYLCKNYFPTSFKDILNYWLSDLPKSF